MEKIKVAVIGAGGKMGTRTSNNLVTKFPDKFDVKLVETFPPAVERIEKERGLKVTPVDEALAFADVVGRTIYLRSALIKSRSPSAFADGPPAFSITLRSVSQQSPAQCAAVLPHSPPARIVPARHPADLPPAGTTPRTRPWSSVRF